MTKKGRSHFTRCGFHRPINTLRRELEASLVRQFGSVSLVQQGKIQSILRLEESCRALERSMAESPPEFPEQVKSGREAIFRWTFQRDRLLTELFGGGKATDTGADSADPWSALDYPDFAPDVAQNDARREHGQQGGTLSPGNASDATPAIPTGENSAAEIRPNEQAKKIDTYLNFPVDGNSEVLEL